MAIRPRHATSGSVDWRLLIQLAQMLSYCVLKTDDYFVLDEHVCKDFVSIKSKRLIDVRISCYERVDICCLNFV